MKNRTVPAFSLVLAFVVLCALLAPGGPAAPQTVCADLGEILEPSGLITPGDKNDEIRMLWERVVFTVSQGDDSFPGWEDECRAHVVADFLMKNLTSRAVTKTLFLPLHSYFGDGVSLSAWKRFFVLSPDIVVRVGGHEADLREELLEFADGQRMRSVVLEATFPPSAETPIHVEYGLDGVHGDRSSAVSLNYTMQTGSHWAGTIGSGQIILQFWKPVDAAAPLGQFNDFFRFRDGKLVWEFTDLEPGPAHDIAVTFEPEALDAWAERPAYVKGLQSSDPSQIVGCSWTLPDVETGASWHSALAYLSDVDRPSGGWAIETADEAGGPWLQFDLDRAHTLWGLRIRTGVLECDWDSEYDLLRRPKTIAVSLSGGLTQTVTLADAPAEWQVIPLPGQPTTRVRLTFLDSFPGVGLGDEYLGVGRIELLGVDAGSAGEGPAGACGGPNLLGNGGFEQGFTEEGIGLGWRGFSSSGGAAYTFSADSWPAAVYQGQQSQLIGVSTRGIAASADRYAGIYQLLEGLEPGAQYELSLAGLLREEAAHPGEDPYRYRVQWALAPGEPEWTGVSAWQELPWDAYSLRTQPAAWSTYTTRLLAPGPRATLFLRAWKKWPTSGREVDLNLDAIALRRCP